MGTSTVRIRSGYDAIAVARVSAVCLPGDDVPAEDFTREWWIARSGKDPVGFCCLSDLGDGVAYLELVAVMPKARGQRLQVRLMATALRHARKIGLKVAVSYTAHWNHGSSNSFIASQWRLYTPEYKWGWADGLYWRKTL